MGPVTTKLRAWGSRSSGFDSIGSWSVLESLLGGRSAVIGSSSLVASTPQMGMPESSALILPKAGPVGRVTLDAPESRANLRHEEHDDLPNGVPI